MTINSLTEYFLLEIFLKEQEKMFIPEVELAFSNSCTARCYICKITQEYLPEQVKRYNLPVELVRGLFEDVFGILDYGKNGF